MHMGLGSALVSLRRRFATRTVRRILRRPDVLMIREELARRYLKGDGIEVGALNGALRLPRCARVRYVDRMTAGELRAAYPEVSTVREPDLVSDLESLRGFEDCSLDFVIANHVLEHVENPLRALTSIGRTLRAGGVAFIALPNKDWTFDKLREVTPLAHILRDFDDGPSWSRHTHYVDWAIHVENHGDPMGRAAQLEAEGANIHFHVWDHEAMREMFAFAESPTRLQVLTSSQRSRGETVWLLRKV
jgi:SAM-dependent methyltransferase